ncbi:hypothetical protein [Undibacterium oligocarboniphilum]|uniref:Tetratricopeptide repeat protein n=1 Tax=Undibacterium oligocarboniphilum TaxID=666702 RepID=A0A850QK86_9BURK|nr:hypothetical protein [Undibacterium oligocarboniphilum]MBC3869577.1 hypothetical protein [Undibacterium oligocarboniphilum]NVO77955.1 hypothetical protein [Undibacterium oligocarboniphilum]
MANTSASRFFRYLQWSGLALAGNLALSPQAMAFSETAFRQAMQQLTTETPCSVQARAEQAVAAWLHQDMVNSLQQAESEQNCQSMQRAAAGFSSLLQQEPGNPLLMAYSGAATSKLAATDRDRHAQANHLQQGMALLDQALQIAPEFRSERHGQVPVALEIEFVAANTFLALPEAMQRQTQGTQLLQQILNDSSFEESGLPFRGAVWLRAARLAIARHQPEVAKQYLEQAVSKQTPQAGAAQQLLMRYPDSGL